ncbi:hypothetical protein P8452_39677 [Trifolium repens]|nr:hypothetical protein P8452_39677 [Trifolium repens]
MMMMMIKMMNNILIISSKRFQWIRRNLIGLDPFSYGIQILHLMRVCPGDQTLQQNESTKEIEGSTGFVFSNCFYLELSNKGGGNQFQKALEVLPEMKGLGLHPNRITFSILIVASEKKDGMEEAQMPPSQAKKDGASPTLIMCRCIIGEHCGILSD